MIDEIDLINYINSLFNEIVKDIDLKTGKKSNLSLSKTDLDGIKKMIESLPYYKELTTKDLEINSETSRLVKLGFYLSLLINNSNLTNLNSVQSVNAIYDELFEISENSVLNNTKYAKKNLYFYTYVKS